MGSWWHHHQCSPDVTLPSIFFQLQQDPQTFPSQMWYMFSPLCSRSTKVACTGWRFLQNLHIKVPRSYSDKMHRSPQLASFKTKEQWLYFKLPLDVWILCPISKAELSHPTEKINFDCLYSSPHSFSHCPKLMTIDDGWNADSNWLVNWRLCLWLSSLFTTMV